MTVTATSPNDTIDILELNNELRKARGELDSTKPRIASKEDIQRERAIRIRVARVEELMNEHYGIDSISFITGEPKHVIARDIEVIRAKQHEKEKRDEYVSDMLFGSSSYSSFHGVIH